MDENGSEEVGLLLGGGKGIGFVGLLSHRLDWPPFASPSFCPHWNE